jgi:hypothetical protein
MNPRWLILPTAVLMAVAMMIYQCDLLRDGLGWHREPATLYSVLSHASPDQLIAQVEAVSDHAPMDDRLSHYDNSSLHSDMHIYIVYFALIYPQRANWLELIRSQLEHLSATGLAPRARRVFVCVSYDRLGVDGDRPDANVLAANATITSILPDAVILYTFRNTYEYPGIMQVWQLAQTLSVAEATRSVVLYFHSKGMVNVYHGESHAQARSASERHLFQTVIVPWQSIVHGMQMDATINKAGYVASDSGYIFFNFWWARLRYIQGLPRPQLTQRFYYEVWLRTRPTHVVAHPRSIRWSLAALPWWRYRHHFSNASSDCWSLGRPSIPLGMYFDGVTMPPLDANCAVSKCHIDTSRPRKRRKI